MPFCWPLKKFVEEVDDQFFVGQYLVPQYSQKRIMIVKWTILNHVNYVTRFRLV